MIEVKSWFRFIDSFRFLNKSLDKLGETIGEGRDPREAYKAISWRFPDDEEFALMTQKGEFPYEFFICCFDTYSCFHKPGMVFSFKPTHAYLPENKIVRFAARGRLDQIFK